MWAAQEFGWPPDVTRRQTWRDLRVLAEAHAERVQMMRGV